MNPNVIHATGSTTVTSVSSNTTSASPTTSTANNKPQVITQNMHAKLSGGSKDDRQQQESLVVSVPLSSATTVPGIQLPTTNSSNSNNISSVSTVVTNQAQPHSQPPIASPTMSASLSVQPQGSLYQHLTNNQPGSQRASPLIQQGVGRASPITPTPNLLVNDSHSSVNNHTSVLQNMNTGTGGVISSTGFHGVTTISETTPSGMLKMTYEKQATTRVQAIQQEQTSRRSR